MLESGSSAKDGGWAVLGLRSRWDFWRNVVRAWMVPVPRIIGTTSIVSRIQLSNIQFSKYNGVYLGVR